METVPSCDTFQGTSLLMFSMSERIAVTQIRLQRNAVPEQFLTPHSAAMQHVQDLKEKHDTLFISLKKNNQKAHTYTGNTCKHTTSPQLET